ncbi:MULTISPECIES: cache domain-containing protein [unclassified Vibrio]|uniref:diguanylate cyclase n=1 Tax=Vibrio sp. HB236076 TaxID=3232307 RepID=A0AB39HJR7_9VIBR|nr:cache domain-containing protein [Vibrio sp. HB161653]MDP5253108.1 cache domain-containing protein [Vibrio sp. HB161653]
MKKKRLTLLVLLSSLSLAAITLFVSSMLWINSIYQKYQQDLISVQQQQIDNAKQELQNRVDTISGWINYRSASVEQTLKDNLANRVFELNLLMEDIYQKNRTTLSEQQIKQRIVDTVRSLRYNQGRGYYFIDTLEGDVILYPIFPESEGKNLINLQDDQGNYSLRDEINMVKNHGEGFTEGYWIKPGNDRTKYKKIAYVKKFAHFNWYIGTGEYVDVMEQQTQQEIIHYINHLLYGDGDKQYVFIHNEQGVELANGQYPAMVGRNNYNLTDDNGVKILQAQIEIAQSPPGHGFLTHLWPSVDDNQTITQHEKLTYVRGLPQWGWVIGSGVDMTELKRSIAQNQRDLYEQFYASIIDVISLALGIFVLSALFANYMTNHIRNGIEFFTQHLQSSSAQLSGIDLEDVEYKEFDMLAAVFNKKTKKINRLLNIDPLTEIYNRRFLDQLLEQEWQTSQQQGTSIAVVLLDIDHFKQFNDRYGHQIGDDVLKQVSQAIYHHVGGQGYVGRYGGEEILVILPHHTAQQAYQLAESIRQKIAQLRLDNIEQTITVSGGVSDDNHSACRLIGQADDYLYRAKKLGRNQIIYTDSPNSDSKTDSVSYLLSSKS